MRSGLPPPTDKSAADAHAARGRWSSKLLADFGGQFSQHIVEVGDKLRVLAGLLAVQGREGQRQGDPINHLCTGEAERLAGLIVRPHTAVPAARSPYHGERLA